MFSKWRESLKNEDGVNTGSIILIVGGFASVAIIATLWIGNTTAGLAADTANCVVRAVGPAQVDPTCASNGATGAGGGNAAAADLSRPLPQNWISDFGSGSGKYDVAKLNQAKGNLERGMLRFSGLKLTLYSDIQGSLTKLKNASTKDAALAALQELRATMYAAQRDGETSTSESTIQVAANLFREIKHPAYETTQNAQKNAQNGNLDVRDAYASVGSGIDNYSSMTLAQLKALVPGIDASVKSSSNYYNTAVGQLKEAIAIVDANR